MNKKIYILLVFIFGFFLMPSVDAVACGGNKECCKKEIKTSKTEKKSCCNSPKKHHEKDSKKHDCGGKYGDSACNCPVSAHFALPNFTTISHPKSFIIASQTDWHFLNGNHQSVYLSLWLPPKISC
jgi:hypothetical protein